MDEILKENSYYDALAAAETLGREFVDADILEFRNQGIDLPAAAMFFITHYEKGPSMAFIGDLKNKVLAGRNLTQPQVRAALNVMQREAFGTQPKAASREGEGIACFTCQATFPTWDELMAHKRDAHGTKSNVADVPLDDGSESIPVIEVTTAIKGMDLSGLPDGRYAAPDVTGKNDYIFLMVKRVKRTHERDRRFVYGKVITGREVVVAGTIEVKIWSSDSKELIGEQKPGDVYRGKYEDELELIMLNPQPWAILFGKLVGQCCICGKTLTDDISRAIGMGLDCEKKVDYWKKVRYSYIGSDRPDADKADPNDDKYLSGTWAHYVKPASTVLFR